MSSNDKLYENAYDLLTDERIFKPTNNCENSLRGRVLDGEPEKYCNVYVTRGDEKTRPKIKVVAFPDINCTYKGSFLEILGNQIL